MKKLSETPSIHETAKVTNATLGRYTEIGANCIVANSTIGDYSYAVEGTQIAYATIGKFANIASHVRIYASMHPMERASLHHFTYRAGDYFEGESNEAEFFAGRAAKAITIGHDTWIGHGAVIMPGITIGDGAIIGSNAVVTKDVAPYTIVGGVAAQLIRRRFSRDIADRLQTLAWWDWTHERLQGALEDFRHLSIEAFIEKHKA